MTAIEWTDETWNPTTGCDRISPGCDNCYALTMAARLKGMGQAKYQNDGHPRTSGPGFALTEHHDALDAPLHWRKPRKVFVNSMSDLFHQDATDEFIAQVFAVMAVTPQHTYQVLTKRPQRMADLLNTQRFWGDVAHAGGGMDIATMLAGVARWHYSKQGAATIPNVWLGTSIENDRYAFRADHLRRTPAAVRFISAEPLLGPLPSLDLEGIDWLIVGGESGPGCRPIEAEWVRDLRDRCNPARPDEACPAAPPADPGHCGHWYDCEPCHRCGDDTPDPECDCDRCTAVRPPAFFFKQWGGRTPKANGRDLDGRTWDEYPRSEGEAGTP